MILYIEQHFCNIIVTVDGLVTSNEMIVGQNYDEVTRRAEKAFVNMIKSFDSEASDDDIDTCVFEGYWKSDKQEASICLSIPEVIQTFVPVVD